MSWRRAVCLSILLGGCTAIAPFGSLTTRDGGEDAAVGDDGGTGGMKRVFLSSEGYFANLRGLDGADARCSALAAAQGLGSDYVPWPSAGGGGPGVGRRGGVGARSRVSTPDEPVTANTSMRGVTPVSPPIWLVSAA